MDLPVYPKKNCYADYWMWLRKDMENMGFFFEYCTKYVCQAVGRNVAVDQVKFCEAFMRSNCRREMEMGHPQLASQAAVETVKSFIDVDLGGEVTPFVGDEMEFNDMQMYWVGWIYAYIHYKADIRSEDLIEKMPICEMLEEYVWGHQLSEEGFYQRVKHMFVGDPKCGHIS